MESTAFNRGTLHHAAWNPLHSIMLHGIHYIQSCSIVPNCMASTEFSHTAWNPLHSIGMHCNTLHGIPFIQSCCMESNAFNGIHCTSLHGIHCIQSCCMQSTSLHWVPLQHAAWN